MTTITENGHTTSPELKSAAWATLRRQAGRLIEAGVGIEETARKTGLAVAEVTELAATHATLDGAPERPDVATASAPPVPAVDRAAIEVLLARADRSEDRRIRTVAARIRHDADLLGKLLDNTREKVTLRRRAEKLRAQLAEVEAALGAVDTVAAVPAPRASARPPVDALAYDETARSWLRSHGYPVAVNGRLKNAHLEAFRAAHPEAAA
jgi:hypothetical protein